MSIFHRHKWGIPSGRVQTCSKCGKNRVQPCDHEWEEYEKITGEYQYLGGVSYKIIMKCKKCGAPETFTIL